MPLIFVFHMPLLETKYKYLVSTLLYSYWGDKAIDIKYRLDFIFFSVGVNYVGKNCNKGAHLLAQYTNSNPNWILI